MALDIEGMQRKFDNWINSPEFESDLEDFIIKHGLKKKSKFEHIKSLFMKLNYKPYKRHAHDRWFGDFLIIGTWLIGMAVTIILFAAFINTIGYAVQKLIFE